MLRVILRRHAVLVDRPDSVPGLGNVWCVFDDGVAVVLRPLLHAYLGKLTLSAKAAAYRRFCVLHHLLKTPVHTFADVVDALMLHNFHISSVRTQGVEGREDSSITVAEQGGVLSIQQLHGSCPHHLGRFGLHRPTRPSVVDGARIRMELLPRFQLLPTQLLADHLAFHAVPRQHSVVEDESRQRLDDKSNADWWLEAACLPRAVEADG